MAPSPSEPAATLDALMREHDWIRSLARGLLGDTNASDDLAQDVLVAALDRRPPLEGARLRGWLRTVARRLATRSREREHLRVHGEQRAARNEAEDQDAAQRLELHRRLAAAIAGLDATHRTVLVLRYFEGLPPRAIAARLGLSEAAARKRVSRGLEHLRARLDAESGGNREAWSVALAGLLLPREGAPPGPAAPLNPWLAPLTLMLTKTHVALVAAALALAVLLVTRPWQSEPDPAANSSPVVQVRPEDAEATHSNVADLANSAQVRELAAVASSSPLIEPVGPLVRVRAQDGSLPAGLTAAWVDRADGVNALDLDAQGSTLRPEDSLGGRFFAWAPGFSSGFAPSGPVGADVEVILQRAREVRGRVLEDGGVPERAIRLQRFGTSASAGLTSSEWELQAQLEALGAYEPNPAVLTEPDGSFVLHGLRVGATEGLQLPSTHTLHAIYDVASGPNRGSVTFGPETSEVVIETARLPSVRGRMLWADTGEPLSGSLWVILKDRESDNSSWDGDWLDDEGRFDIGLPVSGRALFGPPAERGSGLEHRSLRLGLDGSAGAALPFEKQVELTDASFPLDVGVLRIERAPTLCARVLGPDGEPISGAALVSDLGRAQSDAGGLATLACLEGPIQVLARDCALATFDAPGRVTSVEDPLELRLSPGTTLEVRTPSNLRHGSNAKLRLRLNWDASPFEGGQLEGPEDHYPMPDALHRTLHGKVYRSEGFSFVEPGAPGAASYALPLRGSLYIPGLRSGGSFRLALVDMLDQAVFERELHLAVDPGPALVDLGSERVTPANLRVRLLDAQGRSVQRGYLYIFAADSGRGKGFSFDGDSIELAPLKPGNYALKVSASGFLSREIAAHELVSDAPELELRLQAARALEIVLNDVSGRPLGAQSIELRCEDGWSATQVHSNVLKLFGKARFPEAPQLPLQLQVQLGTSTVLRSLDAFQTRVELDLPAHGSVAIHQASLPAIHEASAEIVARFRELNGQGRLELRQWFTQDAVELPDLEADLLPGRYSLEVELVQRDEESMDWDQPHVRALATREFEVRAGERTLVVIG